MDKMRSILLLGGGLMQMPAIRAAKKLGLTIHLADGNPACRARADADVFHHIDLKDAEALSARASSIPNLTAVFTAGTDFSSSVAFVAEEHGLPGIPYDIAMRATDKARMRTVLAAAGVEVPKYVPIENQSAVDYERIGLALPLVVKPVDNMGARGVVRVDNYNALPQRVEEAISLSRSGRAIVEELIVGQEYSLDAIVTEDTIRVTGIGIRHIFFEPYFVELGHTIPAPLTDDERAALEQTFIDAIRAIGITRGAAKGDIFLRRDGDGKPVAVVGEIAARLSGGFMSGWTYPHATEVPLTEIGIRVALGEDVPDSLFTEVSGKITAERALISAPGKVIEVLGRDEAWTTGGEELRELFVHCHPGDLVGPPSNNVQKIANAISTGSDAATADRSAVGTLGRLVARLEVGRGETERFLFLDGWNSIYARYSGYDGVAGPLSDLPNMAQIESTTGVEVRQLPDDQRLSTENIAEPATEVLDRCLAERLVTWNPDALDGPTVLFWRAFMAAGIQGVWYINDAVNASGWAALFARLVALEENDT